MAGRHRSGRVRARYSRASLPLSGTSCRMVAMPASGRRRIISRITDPHTMDFARFARATATAIERHLSLGYGIHHCIGRHLGHAEVVTAIGLLLHELPTLHLAVDAADIPRKVGHAVAGPTRPP